MDAVEILKILNGNSDILYGNAELAKHIRFDIDWAFGWSRTVAAKALSVLNEQDEALYQEGNSGSISSYVEETGVGRLFKPSNLADTQGVQVLVNTRIVTYVLAHKAINVLTPILYSTSIVEIPTPTPEVDQLVDVAATLSVGESTPPLVSSSAMALSLLVVSISFYLKEYISPDSDLYATLSLVSVAGVVVMVIAFSLGLGVMPWIIMSEILPINIKGLAESFATLVNWFFSWLVTLTANLLLDWSSGGFVAIWVPETKGKTLEEIQQFFR
ncbi:uncharacterized protein LOC127138129 [Lathyrus oleraceus]|uniref:uncharacterized protein LOC127138129 n=1 Tax=Pisum sativum TaxID=3888 RepID=UPI0021D1AB29|nr:uncharacterized protein LOC127138129 [Pisum sativum]